MVQWAGLLIQSKAHSFAMFESRYTGWNHETLMKLEMDLVCQLCRLITIVRRIANKCRRPMRSKTLVDLWNYPELLWHFSSLIVLESSFCVFVFFQFLCSSRFALPPPGIENITRLLEKVVFAFVNV